MISRQEKNVVAWQNMYCYLRAKKSTFQFVFLTQNYRVLQKVIITLWFAWLHLHLMDMRWKYEIWNENAIISVNSWLSTLMRKGVILSNSEQWMESSQITVNIWWIFSLLSLSFKALDSSFLRSKTGHQYERPFSK